MQPISVDIKSDSTVAQIAAFMLKSDTCAIVFRRTIFLHNISVADLKLNQRLLCHELTHVLQWKRYGIIRFPILYVWFSILYGYYRNPFEIEARSKEEDLSILKKFVIK